MSSVKKYIRLVGGLCLATTVVIGGISLIKFVGESIFQSYIILGGVFTGLWLAVSYALKDMPQLKKKKE